MGQTSRDPLYKRSSAHRALVTALIDHFGLLHDYTRTLNPGFTTGLTLYVVIFQAFTINRPLDYALDSLGLNELSASIIVVLLISVPIFLLISTVAFIIMETRVKRRLDNLPDEVHAHSAWYTIYAYVYRFSFFVTEPATTGFVLSAWISSDSDYQTKRLVSKTVTIILTFIALLGNFQSAFYVYLVEGILPGNTILSATTKFHVLTLNLMQKVSMAADALSVGIAKYHPNKTYISLLSLLRCSASIVTLPFVYHDTYFFSHHGRFMMGSIHAIIVFVTCLISARYLYNRDSSDPESLLIPIFLASSGILKALWNISRGSSFKPIRPDNCTLSVIIEAAELTILINEDEDEESSGAAVLLAQVEANLSSEDKKFWRFHEKALDGTTSHSKAISFVLYLFKLQIQRQPGMSFILKLYLVYYIVRLRMSIYQVNIYLEDLNTAYSTMSRTVSLDSVKRLVIARLRDYSEGRLSFMNTFSSSYLIGMQAKPVSTALKDNNPNTQAPLPSAVSFYKAFDAFKAHKVLISYMNKAIDEVMKIYELNDKRNISNSLIHQYCSKIRDYKIRVREAFDKVESIGILNYRFHLLPYGLFVDALCNDKATLYKMFKQRQERAKNSMMQVKKFMNAKDFKNISAKQSIIFVTSTSQESFGLITNFTMNHEQVFGVGWEKFQNFNVSELVSPQFVDQHDAIMRSFCINQDKPYLGITKPRYARICGGPQYHKISIITKIYPNLEDRITFISMMRNDDLQQNFLVISSRGTISGYSKEISNHIPSVMQLAGSKLSVLSNELQNIFAAKFTDQLLTQKLLDQTTVTQAMRHLGLNTAALEHYRMSPKLETLRLPSITNASKSTFSLYSKTQSVRVHSLEVEPIVSKHDGLVFVEGILHITFQMMNSDTNKKVQSFEVDDSSDNFFEDDDDAPGAKSIRFSTNGNYSKNKKSTFKRMRTRKSRMATLKLERSFSILRQENEKLYDTQKKLLPQMPKAEQILLGTGTETEDQDMSSIGSNSMKSKLGTAIRKQRKQYIWKEMLGVLMVQLVVWFMCFYNTILLDQNFYQEMKTLIELRKGILYLTITNAQLWGLCSTMFDEMLIRAGYLKNDRITQLSPAYTYSYMNLSNFQFNAAQNYSLTFTRQVYSFPWDYANRYLTYKANYTSRYSDYVSDKYGSQMADLIDCYKFALGSMRRWRDQIMSKSVISNQDFDHYAIQDFLSAMGPGILEQIGTPTLLLIMDKDFNTFTTLISRTRLIIVLTIVMSLVLSNAILLIVYLVRNKITFLYSVFHKLTYSEMADERTVLIGLRKTLLKSNEYEDAFLEEFNRHSRRRNAREGTPLHTANNNSKRIRKITSSTGWTKRLGCAEFYNLLNFVAVIFVLMEVFNITALSMLSTISSETNRKLDMLTMSRATVTGTASLHTVTYRLYALSIQLQGIGLAYYTRATYIKAMYASLDALTIQLKLIENQLDTKFEPFPHLDQVGWNKFRHSKPCEYVNRVPFNLTVEGCEGLANGIMGETPSEMYRWFRHANRDLLNFFESLTPQNAMDLIKSRFFTEFNFLRRVFAVPYVIYLNFDFFQLIMKYHDRIRFMTQNILGTQLIVSIFLSLILNVIGFWHMRKQVTIGLSCLELIPTSIYNKNPYVAVMLKQLG